MEENKITLIQQNITEKYISEMKAGEDVCRFFMIKKIEKRMAKNGKEYLSIDIGDKTGTVNCKKWDEWEEIFADVKQGDIVKIKGKAEEYLGQTQIKIDKIRKADEKDAVTPGDFVPVSARSLAVMEKELADRINKIENIYVKQLLNKLLSGENYKKYIKAPAGKGWHHAYIHGLLEHVLELIKICDMMCDIHPEIKRDILMSGAILHDFGKIEELSFETDFEYTDKGKLVGHIVIAAMMVNDIANGIEEFPDGLKTQIIHLVLSHQGKLEFSSPVVPKTLEAITLYYADEMSAKVNGYKNAIIREGETGSNWTKYVRLAETEIYTGGAE